MVAPQTDQLFYLECFHKMGDRMEYFTHALNHICCTITSKVTNKINWASQYKLFEPLSIAPNPCEIITALVPKEVFEIGEQMFNELDERDYNAYFNAGQGIANKVIY